MNWSESELHEKAWEVFKALLVNEGWCHVEGATNTAAQDAYAATLDFLAERERRGWRGANAAAAKETT